MGDRASKARERKRLRRVHETLEHENHEWEVESNLQNEQSESEDLFAQDIIEPSFEPIEDNSYFSDDDYDDSDNRPEFSDLDDDVSFDEDRLNTFPLNNDEAEAGSLVALQSELAKWVTATKTPHSHVNSLLRILKRHDCLATLPTDCRTLVQTPRRVITSAVHPGKYCHFGFSEGILRVLGLLQIEIPTTLLDIALNIDGVSVSESTASELWPILGRVVNIKQIERCVFIVGLYHGKKKPSGPNSFLRGLVDDVKLIKEEGVQFRGKKVSIRKIYFNNDVPANALVKGIKYHSGAHSCGKCTVIGQMAIKESELRKQRNPRGRMVFLDPNAPLRTDFSFRRRLHANHHNVYTILEEIEGLDMVNDFPSEPMHLIYLGLTRKLAEYFISESDFKLSPRAIRSLNMNMIDIGANHTPREFARRAQSFDGYKDFKATEWRQFLNFTGPVLLRSRLPQERYNHFMLLHAAIRILSSKSLSGQRDWPEFINFADQLLLTFVNNSAVLYGEAFLSHNVHNLVHLSKDVSRFGTIKHFSAFVFENYIGTLCRRLKKKGKELEQIAKRLVEEIETEIAKPLELNKNLILKDEHDEGPVLDHGMVQYRRAEYGSLILNCKAPNNCVILNDKKTVVMIENMAQKEEKSYIIGRYYTNVESLYLSPIDSSVLNIKKVSNLSENLNSWLVSEIHSKVFRIPIPHVNSFAIFPIGEEDGFLE